MHIVDMEIIDAGENVLNIYENEIKSTEMFG